MTADPQSPPHDGRRQSYRADIDGLRALAVLPVAKALCPPILGVEIMRPEYADCAEYNRDVLAWLVAHPELKTVVLVGRFIYYVDGPPVDLGPAPVSEAVTLLNDASGRIHDRTGRVALLVEQLAATTARLVAAGKTVALVYPIPETGYDIPITAAEMTMLGRDPATFTRPLTYYTSRQASAFAALDAVPDSPSVLRIRPQRLLCGSTDCLVFANGSPLYADEDHLGAAGAELIAPLFDPLFPP